MGSGRFVLQCKEARLRLPQRHLRFRHLHDVRRMIWRHAERLSAVNDVLTQSEGKRGDALLGLFVVYGVIVE